jgi:hypothetical protein
MSWLPASGGFQDYAAIIHRQLKQRIEPSTVSCGMGKLRLCTGFLLSGSG